MQRITRFVLAALVFGCGIAAAADSIPALQTVIVTDSTGRLALEVTGTAPDTTGWLGVSFYKPNYTDPIWEGDHAVYFVKQGEFTRRFAVPAGYEAGTYEVALWRKLLGKKELYRLETIRGYGAGSVEKGK